MDLYNILNLKLYSAKIPKNTLLFENLTQKFQFKMVALAFEKKISNLYQSCRGA
jgi:hypothetical protein